MHKELLETIRSVHTGKRALSTEASMQLAEHATDDALTPARYCVKDGSGTIHAEGMIPATRFDLDPHRCSARREVCTARLPNAGK